MSYSVVKDGTSIMGCRSTQVPFLPLLFQWRCLARSVATRRSWQNHIPLRRSFIFTKRKCLFLYHYTKHICFCQVACKKILNFFVLISLDTTKHFCYTGCTMKLHLIQGSVKQVRVDIFAENTTRCLTGSYTDCTVYKQGA